MRTDLDTHITNRSGDDPADQGFMQLEFPPSYTDFADARRRFLDLISLDAAANRSAGRPAERSTRFAADR
jgi:hypothetical protein